MALFLSPVLLHQAFGSEGMNQQIVGDVGNQTILLLRYIFQYDG